MYRNIFVAWLLIISIPLWVLPVILYIGGKEVLPAIWTELTNKNTWRYLFTGDKNIPYKAID